MRSMIRLVVLLIFACISTVSDLALVQERRSSPQVEELILKAESGDRQAILQMGSLGDQSAVPYLQKIREDSSEGFGSASSYAQMALAKLGVKKELDEILKEANSDDPAIQQAAVKKLGYIGGRDAIGALVGLLDQNKYRSMKGFDPNRRGPNGERPQGREVFPPLNLDAMRALSQIVSSPPVDPRATPTEADVATWRRWYEANKDKLR